MRLPESMFQQILAYVGAKPVAAAPRDGVERRNSARASLVLRAALCRLRGQIIGVPQFVRIRDISETGVSLLHTEALAPGERFLISLPRAGAAMVCIQCSVNRCSEWQPGMYVIGAEFRGLYGHAEPASGDWRDSVSEGLSHGIAGTTA